MARAPPPQPQATPGTPASEANPSQFFVARAIRTSFETPVDGQQESVRLPFSPVDRLKEDMPFPVCRGRASHARILPHFYPPPHCDLPSPSPRRRHERGVALAPGDGRGTELAQRHDRRGRPPRSTPRIRWHRTNQGTLPRPERTTDDRDNAPRPPLRFPDAAAQPWFFHPGDPLPHLGNRRECRRLQLGRRDFVPSLPSRNTPGAAARPRRNGARGGSRNADFVARFPRFAEELHAV